jgi:hypothetical protein
MFLLLAFLIVLISCGCVSEKIEVITNKRETNTLPVSDGWTSVEKINEKMEVYLGNALTGLKLNNFGLALRGIEHDYNFVMVDDQLHLVPNLAAFIPMLDNVDFYAMDKENGSSTLNFFEGTLNGKWENNDVEILTQTLIHPEKEIFGHRIIIKNAKGKTFKIIETNGAQNHALYDNSIHFEITEILGGVSQYETSLRASMVVRNYQLNLSIIGGSLIDIHSSKSENDSYTHNIVFQINDDYFVFDRLISNQSINEKYNYEKLKNETQKWWEKQWETDIEIDGPLEDQLAVRSFMFYLEMGFHPKLPPFGLSNKKYNGHRFWDAEAWILPALLFIDRQKATDATLWRVTESNKEYIPWEQASQGIDATPEEFKSALHVNGWVAWWFEQANIMQLLNHENKRKANIISKKTSQYLKSKLELNKNGHYEIKNVRPPDETRQRNNDLITNLHAKWMISKYLNDEYTASKICIPKDENGIPLSYDNDKRTGYQQASALLAIYPLNWQIDLQTAKTMYDLYNDKVIEYGPAMTEPIHSIVASRLGRQEQAYTHWKNSWRKYVQGGHFQFSERSNKIETYFLTGAGGNLQAVIYGFLGLKLESDTGLPKLVSKSLNGGYRLSIEPRLPKNWKSVTFKNMHLPDGKWTIEVTHDKTTLRKGG